ncbi:MAG: hypothetical protein R3B68_13045 [Phycisphaerales bacterium]
METIRTTSARPAPSLARGLGKSIGCAVAGALLAGVLYVLIEEMDVIRPSARLLVPVALCFVGLAIGVLSGLVEVLRATSGRLGFVPVALGVATIVGGTALALIAANGHMFV